MFKKHDRVKLCEGELNGKCGTIVELIKGYSFVNDDISEEVGVLIKVDDGFPVKGKLEFLLTIEKNSYKCIEKVM